MQIKKATIAIMMSFVTAFAFADFASAQGYSPLVQIPGVSLISGTTNLSLYLVGMYDFLLSVVGIVAVMMLIIGGMKYITAAGNQATVSDAKDTIYNALFGLLLAILSWVIVAEINPDVLYIKQPGGEFASSDSVDLGLCGTYDPVAGTCICDDLTPIAGATDARNCHDQCMAGGHCGVMNSNICIIPATPNGDTEQSREELTEMYEGLCQCISGVEIAPAAAVDCQTTCANDYGLGIFPACLKVQVLIGFEPNSYVSLLRPWHMIPKPFSIPIDTTMYYEVSIYDPQNSGTNAVFGLDCDGGAADEWTINTASLSALDGQTFDFTYSAFPAINPTPAGFTLVWDDPNCTGGICTAIGMFQVRVTN